jgi:GDP-L-fucose synthase
MITKYSKIFIAGHNGMVGSSIFRVLKKKGYKRIITIPKSKLNLLNQQKVINFFLKFKPDVTISAAGKVGGIIANSKFKAEFIYENLMIQTNLIHSSYISGVKNFIFLGSSCVYPKLCKQPIKENYLLSSNLEETNDAYAIAKISGIKMCEEYRKNYNLNYFSLMPCNLYGPNDNYDINNSHFIPALIKKIYNYKLKKTNEIKIWGSGKPKREVLYVDDIANACLFFLKKKPKHSLINIGSGKDKTILEYAKIICKILKVKPKFAFDKRKPNGTPRKCLDINLSKNYGWKAKTDLHDGLKLTIQNFIKKKI